MLNRKTSSKKIDEAVAHSVNFEITVADLARKSERRAWTVAFCSVALSLILAGICFYILPLKEKVPYLVMADAYTGTSSIARLTDSVLDHQISTNDAINRSNVAHFVLAREAYDYQLIQLRDWTTVQTMSAPQVQSAYSALYQMTNADNPYKLYGKDRAIRVKLLSIVMIGGGANGGSTRGATVRFQRSLYDKNTGQTKPLDSKIATIEFTYKPNLRMDDAARIENPLGFQVTSYRVDNDYATAPPEEIPSTEPQQPQAQQTAAATTQLGPDGQPIATTQAVPGQPVQGQVAPTQAAPGEQPAPGQAPVATAGESLQAAPPPFPQRAAPPAPPAQVQPTTPAPRNTSNGVGRR